MGPQLPAQPQAPKVDVKVEIAGEDVVAIITQKQTDQSLSGSFVDVNRVDRFRTLAI
jgi:hypothetical protein